MKHDVDPGEAIDTTHGPEEGASPDAPAGQPGALPGQAEQRPLRDVRRTRAEPGDVAPTAPRRKRVYTEEQKAAERERNRRARMLLTEEQRERKRKRDRLSSATAERRERRREYVRKHPEKNSEKHRKYREANLKKVIEKDREYARKWRSDHPEKCRDRCRRRRTVTRRGEFVGLFYLRTRDGNVCGICSFPVPPEARHPHPLSATLDHIIPLKPAKGATHAPGEHIKRNCRLAHLRCNVKRGNRYRGEPMLDLDEGGQYLARKVSL